MFGQALGIDIGSANTVVVVRRRGIVAREPSVVAVNRKTRAVIAVGTEAHRMVGRTPDTIISVRPVQGGVIADLRRSAALLRHLMGKVAGSRWLRPRVVLTVPTGASAVEQRALAEAALEGGAGEVFLLEEAVAAALGAGLPVHKPEGSLLVDVGSGTTDVAVVALGGVVVSASTTAAGDQIDEAIARHVKRMHNLLIGEPTAEQIKLRLGAALPGRTDAMPVTGRLVSTGIPAALPVTAGEVYEAMRDTLAQIDALVCGVLERTPPELLADISRRGLTLTGGMALLPDLDRRLAQVTGLTVHVAESPMDAVANGIGMVLEHPGQVRLTQIKRRRKA
jgi:rod shape-determining protein MreB